MSLDYITEKIREKVSLAADISAKAKFNFGDDGVVFVDATQSPPDVSHEDGEADVEFVCSLETGQAIVDGTQDPNIAFMMGKLKVKGNMGLAMKINGILEG